MNTINGQPKAARQLRKLPGGAQREIRDRVSEKLSVFPHCTIPHEVVSAVVDGLSPIRAWREHLGLTDAEVAARIQVAPAVLAEWEAPDARPRKAILRQIAAALGLSLEQLDF